MFKKIGIVTALSTALLLGGAFQTSVDASAKTDQSQVQSYKVFYSVNGQWGNISEDQINNLLKDYLGKFQINWKQLDWNKQKEQPKTETVEQPEQKEPNNAVQGEPVKNEKQPVKQEEPVKQQQTEKQPEAPVQQPVKEQEQQEQSQAQSQELSQFEQEVVTLTNKEREKNGLDPLKIDVELSKVAREKSKDMATNNYFDHNSPTYGSPFDMMKSYGVTYRTAGENIAKGQRTPAEVVNGWMNSEGHRANILNGDFTHIGVGYVEQGNHWTQQFIGK